MDLSDLKFIQSTLQKLLEVLDRDPDYRIWWCKKHGFSDVWLCYMVKAILDTQSGVETYKVDFEGYKKDKQCKLVMDFLFPHAKNFGACEYIIWWSGWEAENEKVDDRKRPAVQQALEHATNLIALHTKQE